MKNPLIASNYGMSGAMAGAFTATMITILVLAAIFYILTIVARWKIFTKAGEKGWKSIIPIYNDYVTIKLCWKPLFFWVTLVLAILVGICQNAGTYISGPIVSALGVFGLIFIIASCVFFVIGQYRLAKSFGKGGAFTVGLVFFNFIFLMILAFGKAEYKGNVYLNEKK